MRESGQSQNRKSSTPRPWVEICEPEDRTEEITQTTESKRLKNTKNRLRGTEHRLRKPTIYLIEILKGENRKD